MTDPHDSSILRIGHSPDPDDAFMWWPLLEVNDGPHVDVGGFRYRAVIEDIERLNERSESGELEITAMSCAQYPRVADRYALTACGASLGDAYGPRLVSRDGRVLDDVRGGTIAVPGTRTSAFAGLSLVLGAGGFQYAVVPFEEIIDAVAAGRFDAGLVIHEGQLTFGESGLHQILDLGAWWHDRTGLPLPLGVNTVRRDLETHFGPGTLAAITRTLRASVEYALEHREESIAYALDYARDMGADRADEFVAMYVNRWTLDFEERGRSAVRRFLTEIAGIGLVPPVEQWDVDIVAAAPTM